MTALVAPGVKKPELLKKYGENHPIVPIDLIISEVSKYYNLYESDILGRDKHIKISIARQISMYLCKYYNAKVSLVHIGKKFGRTHNTVLRNIRKIKGYLDVDEVMKKDIEKIKMNILFN